MGSSFTVGGDLDVSCSLGSSTLLKLVTLVLEMLLNRCVDNIEELVVIAVIELGTFYLQHEIIHRKVEG